MRKTETLKIEVGQTCKIDAGEYGLNIEGPVLIICVTEKDLEKEMTELKGQVPVRTKGNKFDSEEPFCKALLHLHANPKSALDESKIRVQNLCAVQQFVELITKNGLTFQEATSCFRWARWNVFNEGGMPTGDNPILKDQ